MVECESKISVGIKVSDRSEDLIEQLKESVTTPEAKLATSKFCIELQMTRNWHFTQDFSTTVALQLAMTIWGLQLMI